MTERLRLVKVVAQPVFVLDDGESLREYAAAPVTVNSADWQRWAVDTFTEENLAHLAVELSMKADPSDAE